MKSVKIASALTSENPQDLLTCVLLSMHILNKRVLLMLEKI